MNATAELANLEDAKITVQYVNEPKPGKKLGNVKDADGQIWFVRPNMLNLFRPGEDYKVEYTESHANGMMYRHIKSAYPATPPRAMTAPSNTTPAIRTPALQTNGNQYYRPTAPRDSERMFVCSTLNAFIQTGRIECDENALIERVTILRSVYAATFGIEDPAAE